MLQKLWGKFFQIKIFKEKTFKSELLKNRDCHILKIGESVSVIYKF